MTDRTKSLTPCTTHSWGIATELREPMFNVAYGAYRLCRFCAWGQFVDFTAGRTGGNWKLLTPQEVAKLDKPE